MAMDNDKKRVKSQRSIAALEKDLASATKEIQALATPSKMLVAVMVMAVMFGINKRCEHDDTYGEGGIGKDIEDYDPLWRVVSSAG